MKKIIIGIHGLGNKPGEKLLKKWWENSIYEGITNINPNIQVPFDMVYWADILHDKRLDEKIKDPQNQYYLDEPYTPGKRELKRKSNNIKKRIFKFAENLIDKLFLNRNMTTNYNELIDKFIQRYFKDLDIYYCDKSSPSDKKDCDVRAEIQKRLVDKLSEYKDHKILLIAHSMGSIVAFDVLWDKQKELEINTFITIGSPLGLPVIVSRMFNEQKKITPRIKKPHVPESIGSRWVNLADPEDHVALDPTLFDDYGPSPDGIRAVDKTVFNNYCINEIYNPHKSYGYLRTREIAEEIINFLGPDHRSNLFWQIKNKIFNTGSAFLKIWRK